MLSTLAIDGYRSIRSLRVALGRVTVVTGPNGSGKSSLYRGLRLLAAAGRHGAVAALAGEGGLPSTLWAGPEVIGRAVRQGRAPAQGTVRQGPVALRLGFAGDGFSYAVDLGLPTPSGSMFERDPEIKVESIWHGPILRPSTLLAERRGSQVRIREDTGWTSERKLQPWESMLDEVDAPEIRAVRAALRGWRFYDHVRTDAAAPARAAMLGTRTPVLSGDAGDLAAAIQTIREIGNADLLDATIDEAFPGSTIMVTEHDGRMTLQLRQPNLLRPLDAAELSDGTLRYLVWAAALLSPRPAELIVLNEPETSLHPELLRPLARMITRAADDSQVIVVTHAGTVVEQLRHDDARLVELEKPDGETLVVDQGALDGPPWQWPKR
ncbi:AAA family ATPase [Microlunatus soli]|uniref:AAA family ATPase n=1 Tax=Microlunatus soli TaxID=630515 RepID=UPI000B8A2DF0|nr:AAA family ATPase [Microlunatus soli]